MFDEALIEIVQDLLRTMFSVEITLDNPRPEAFDTESLTVTTQFTGHLCGELRVTYTGALARSAASAMMGSHAAEISLDDCIDATAELTNIIAGNLKGLLRTACQLSLPSVQAGRSIRTSYPSLPVGRAAFQVFGEPMWVELARTG